MLVTGGWGGGGGGEASPLGSFGGRLRGNDTRPLKTTKSFNNTNKKSIPNQHPNKNQKKHKTNKKKQKKGPQHVGGLPRTKNSNTETPEAIVLCIRFKRRASAAPISQDFRGGSRPSARGGGAAVSCCLSGKTAQKASIPAVDVVHQDRDTQKPHR